MRVFRKDAGRWCRFKWQDKEYTGIVFEGGSDKLTCLGWGDPLYRACSVCVPGGEEILYDVDWPDVIALGPAVKAPKF